MDSNEPPVSEPPTDSQQSPSPVMDVMPPAQSPEATPPSTSQSPVNPPTDSGSPEPPPKDMPAHTNASPSHAGTKAQGGSNAAAITATVLIVLGLAALATFAYIKTR